mgnify:CR=1 FL=1
MKPKHIEALIRSCLAFAACSTCTRRTFGALLVDPVNNSIVSEGYNGAPMGGREGELCGGSFCLRDGLVGIDIELEDDPDVGPRAARVVIRGTPQSPFLPREEANDHCLTLLMTHPRISSGERCEVGCHHAEMNALTRAARRGVPTLGTWLVVTSEPCLLCAKLLHHAGVAKVLCVRDGYAGGDSGVRYLEAHGVTVVYVKGPRDPRLTPDATP